VGSNPTFGAICRLTADLVDDFAVHVEALDRDRRHVSQVRLEPSPGGRIGICQLRRPPRREPAVHDRRDDLGLAEGLDNHRLNPCPHRAADGPAGELQIAALDGLLLDGSEQIARRDQPALGGFAPLAATGAVDPAIGRDLERVTGSRLGTCHPDDRNAAAANLDVQGMRSGGELDVPAARALDRRPHHWVEAQRGRPPRARELGERGRNRTEGDIGLVGAGREDTDQDDGREQANPAGLHAAAPLV